MKSPLHSLPASSGEGIRVSTITVTAVFVVLYITGAELGYFSSFKSQHQAFEVLWPPAGLFLATLAVSRYRSWLPIVVAAWGANLFSDVLIHGRSLPTSMAFCVAHTLEAGLGAWLLRHFVGLPFTLTRIRDVVTLACISGLSCTAAGATIGAVIVASVEETSYFSAWQMWTIGHLLGVLMMAPVVFTWTAEPRTPFKELPPWQWAERVLHLVGVIVVTEAVYGNLLPRPLRIPVLILPFMLWAAIRLGPQGAARAVLVSALIGVWNVSQGLGPYSSDTIPASEQLRQIQVGEQMLRAQGTLAMISLCVHLLAATIAERNQAERDRMASLVQLQQALAEIKTLQGLIPICSWCKSIRDDMDFWHSVEDYISEHTEARFSHGICPQCLARAIDDSTP